MYALTGRGLALTDLDRMREVSSSSADGRDPSNEGLEDAGDLGSSSLANPCTGSLCGRCNLFVEICSGSEVSLGLSDVKCCLEECSSRFAGGNRLSERLEKDDVKEFEVGGGEGDVIVPVETMAAFRGIGCGIGIGWEVSAFASDDFFLSKSAIEGRRGGADFAGIGGALCGGLAKASSARA